MIPELNSIVAGRFRLVRNIGEGGMSHVYEAEDIELRRRVAVKFLRSDFQSQPEIVKRFRNEAVAAARIRSPHIVTVLDVGVDEWQRPYIVQELLEGGDLRALIDREGRLEPTRAVALAIQACEALSAVHDAGFVHRDIKPGNLFIRQVGESDERLALLDFGIAKVGAVPEEGMSATQTGQVMGTPLYMSPEQAMGKSQIDSRSDIYSLGATLFEAVTGERPFDGQGIGDLIVQIVTKPPPSPSIKRPISPQLDQVILKCLAKDPSDRFESANELRAALLSVPEALAMPSTRPPILPSAPLFSGTLARANDTLTNADRPPKDLLDLGSTAFPLDFADARLKSIERPGIRLAFAVGIGATLAAGTLALSAPLWLVGAVACIGVIGPVAVGLGMRRRRSLPASRTSEAPLPDGAGVHSPPSPPIAERPTTEPSLPRPRAVEAPKPGLGASPLDEEALVRFLNEAGLKVTSRQNGALLLERTAASPLRNLSYAATILEPNAFAPRATMATAVFQSHASSLYALRGEPGREIHTIVVLQSLPGPGVYREWHVLATTRHVRILPVTPDEVTRALAEHRAPQLITSLTRRAQSDAFSHAGPVTTDFEFFGRSQLERLVRRLLDGKSLGLFGLYKWGTTSLLLRIRSELENRATVWVDLAALPRLDASSVCEVVVEQLRAWRIKTSGRSDTAFAQPGTDPQASLRQVLREFQGLEPPIVFIDRTEELLRLVDTAPNEFDGCLRWLYAMAFPPPGAVPLLFVLAGNDDQILLQRTFTQEAGVLKNHLWNRIDIEYTNFFEREELDDFLVRLGPYAGLSFTDTGLVEVYRRTGGHKYLCRELGSALVRHHGQRAASTHVGSRDIAELVPGLVARQAHYFEAVFERAPRSARRALARLVNGPMGMLDFLGLAAEGGGTGGGALPALQFALNFGLVAEQAGRYELRIRLLGEWLLLSREHSSGAPSGDASQERARSPVPPAKDPVPPSTNPPSPSGFPGSRSASRVSTIYGVAPPATAPEAGQGPDVASTIMATTPPPDQQRELRTLIVQTLSWEELQIIAHDLGGKLDHIAPTQSGIELQAMRLIDWAIRTGQFETLQELLRDRAPGAFGRANST